MRENKYATSYPLLAKSIKREFFLVLDPPSHHEVSESKGFISKRGQSTVTGHDYPHDIKLAILFCDFPTIPPQINFIKPSAIAHTNHFNHSNFFSCGQCLINPRGN